MSENAAFFRETVERVLTDTLDQSDIEACVNRQFPTATYDALFENGVSLILVPEAQGGIGGDLFDAQQVLRAAGHAALPGLLLESMLGNFLLAAGGQESAEAPLALAFTEPGTENLFSVPWGGDAKQLLVLQEDSGATLVTRLTPPQMTVENGFDTAGEPRDTLSGSFSGESFKVDVDVPSLLQQASILRAGQILGAVEWVLKRSIEYAGEREQFGRPIAKFQAVQQMLAELSGHALAAAGIAEAAAASPNPTLVAAARSRLGDASDAAIAIGHQVHGAMGFSMEYALNHRTRRLMAWRNDFGSVAFWRRSLAENFTTCSREQFWPAVSDAGLNEVA